MDKEFYIPSVQQIEEICRIGYEESSLAYKKLQAFFRKKLDLPYEQAVSWCLQVWANSYEGDSPADVISKMTEADIMFKNEKQMNEFVGLLMDAHNNTRLKENRGHKPDELIRREFTEIYPNDPCPCGSGKKYKKCCGRR